MGLIHQTSHRPPSSHVKLKGARHVRKHCGPVRDAVDLAKLVHSPDLEDELGPLEDFFTDKVVRERMGKYKGSLWVRIGGVRLDRVILNVLVN